MRHKTRRDIILTISEIFLFFYSLPLYIIALFLSPSKNIYGEKLPVENRIIALGILLIALFFSLSSIWLLKKGGKLVLPRWLQFLIVFTALFPLIFYPLNRFLVDLLF